MKIALGNDHAGFPLKAFVQSVLEDLGHEVIDCGRAQRVPGRLPGHHPGHLRPGPLR